MRCRKKVYDALSVRTYRTGGPEAVLAFGAMLGSHAAAPFTFPYPGAEEPSSRSGQSPAVTTEYLRTRADEVQVSLLAREQ
jgi:hypothetical protein